MYLAIDRIYVYAVLYRNIYLQSLKVVVVVVGSYAQYAGHLGVLIPNWFIYLDLVLSKFCSLYNGWGVAVKHVVCPEDFLVLFNKIR